MKSFKDDGIILRRMNLGEADRILTILTENRGKVKVLAKGVRKTLSKLAGHLEPFCLTELNIVEGRSLDVLSGAQVKKCFINIRSSLKSTTDAFYLAEIIDKMLEEEEKHPEIYYLLDQALENIENTKNPLLQSYFEINILSELGFLPELQSCVICSKKIESGVNYFNFEHGGLVCKDCGHGEIVISDKSVKVLRLFLKHQMAIIDRISPEEELVKEINLVTSGYLKYISQKEFKSEKYLNTK